jgi:cytochrome b subunit of formate dehydrogenase
MTRGFPRKRRSTSYSIGLVAALLATSASRADDPDNCLLCHQYRGLSRLDPDTSRVHLYFVDPNYSAAHSGPHARLACTSCHERTEVSVIPHSTVTRVDCLRECHLSSPSGVERKFSHKDVKVALDNSVHRFETLAETKFTGGALLEPGQSACLYCHDEPIFRDPLRVLPDFKALEGRLTDRCDTCHGTETPAPIEYYLRHVTSRLQPARSTLEQAQVCAVCHSDPKIKETHQLKDAVASFVRSFHGKAALLGEETTANCLSCHVSAGKNAHSMLPHKDPNSSVNYANVADSCRSTLCHPGADKNIALAAVHLDLPTANGTIEYAIAVIFIILTIFTFCPSALLVLLDLFQSVIGREHHADPRVHALAEKLLADPRGREGLMRFKIRHRIQHWILTILFILLVLTGFPMKFADRGWATTIVQAFGGLQASRVVHHWAGIALVVGFMAHMLDVFFVFKRRAQELADDGESGAARKAFVSLPMWISPEDVRKTFQLFAYLLFLRKERPSFGRFSPAEKFEYLGVFWGTMLLGATGLLLWGEEISSQFLSGRAFNIATIAHTYEAFLALIHVGILHIYNVILAPKVFPLSPATLSGHTPVAKLVEEHSDLIHEVAHDLGISKRTPEAPGAD